MCSLVLLAFDEISTPKNVTISFVLVADHDEIFSERFDVRQGFDRSKNIHNRLCRHCRYGCAASMTNGKELGSHDLEKNLFFLAEIFGPLRMVGNDLYRPSG